MSLRVRLTLWVGLASLLVVASLAAVTFREVQDTAVQAVQAEMSRLVKVHAAELRHNPNPARIVGRPGLFVLDDAGNLVLRPSDSVLPGVTAALAAGALRPDHAEVLDFTAPDGQEYWIALQPQPSLGRVMGLAVARREALEGLDFVREEVLVVHLAGTAFLLFLVWLVTGGITRPLLLLSEAARRVARGDLQAPVPPVKRNDEVGELTASFQQMQAELREYIEDLRTTTAEKERLESEMAIGSDIQRSFLPALHEGEDRTVQDGHVRLAALFRPARQMAGDLYDFFPLGPGRLGLVIGDVSGKGMPAALFMAVTHTLIRSVAPRAAGPADCLARVNRLLCAENRSNLFVTVLYGILEEGRLVYASGGHMPPILKPQAGPARELPQPEGMVLGVLEEATFAEASEPLEAGDTLLLYTDGLSEAQNPAEELFGEERIREALEGDGPQALLQALVRRLDAHLGGGSLSDDLTLVALRLEGSAAPVAKPSRS